MVLKDVGCVGVGRVQFSPERAKGRALVYTVVNHPFPFKLENWFNS
jgi:hypothetical protein